MHTIEILKILNARKEAIEKAMEEMKKLKNYSFLQYQRVGGKLEEVNAIIRIVRDEQEKLLNVAASKINSWPDETG